MSVSKKKGLTILIITFIVLTPIIISFVSKEDETFALQVGEPNPEPLNPFGHTKGVPSISIKYNNNTYYGQLQSAAFSYGDVNENQNPLEPIYPISHL